MNLRSTIRMVTLLVILCQVMPAASVAYINYQGGSLADLSFWGHTVNQFVNPSLTLAMISAYDVAVVSSNLAFTDPVNIGNVLGEFANTGKGVVLIDYVFQGRWALGGAIMQHGYSPFTVDPSNSVSGSYPDYLRGAIYDPGSPLFNGLYPIAVHTLAPSLVGVDPGATLVADWEGGRHAVAYRSLASSTVVGLNLFPSGTYYTNEETLHLVANAVDFSMTAHQPPAEAVPEPASFLIGGAGLLFLGLKRRRVIAGV